MPFVDPDAVARPPGFVDPDAASATAPERPLANRANALTGGINRGIAGFAGLPVDTVSNVLNLGRAGIGTIAAAAGRSDLAPDIPSSPIGGSDWIAKRLENIGFNASNPNPNDRASQMLFTGGSILPSAAVPGARIAPTVAAAAGGAIGEQVGGTPGMIAGSMVPGMLPRPAVRMPTPEIAARDANAAAARNEGLTVPPSQTNPTLVNKTMEGIAGKITTAQAASAQNAPIVNSIARRSLNLSPDTQLTDDVLNGIRAREGGAYQAVKDFGKQTNLQFKPDKTFTDSVDSLGREYSLAAKRFPEIAGNAEVETLKTALQRNMSPGEAIELSKKLRHDASVNYRSDDPAKAELAHVQRGAASAIEEFIDRRLMMSGQPDLVKNFREARQTIARTYDVESALNPDTGNVSAQKLAQLANRGRPLGGGLEKAASFANAFPKAAQRPEIIGSQPGWSPLDTMASAGLGIAGHSAGGAYGTLAALLPAIRPAARAMILSGPYQRAFGSPSTAQPETSLAEALRSGVLANTVTPYTGGAQPTNENMLMHPDNLRRIFPGLNTI